MLDDEAIVLDIEQEDIDADLRQRCLDIKHGMTLSKCCGLSA